MPFFFGGGASASNMVGATSSAAGTAGLVPAPAAGEEVEFLRGDATFANPVFLLREQAPATDAYFGFPRVDTGGGTGISNATALLFTPIFVPKKDTYTRIAVQNETSNASGSARLGIYEMDSDGKPSTLILDAGTVSLTSTGIKEITISQLLERKIYYGACVASHSVSWITNGNTFWYFVFNGSHTTTNLRYGSSTSSFYWNGSGATALTALPTNAQTTGVLYNSGQQCMAIALRK